MSVRFYILPVQRVTVNGSDYRGPMYLKWRMNPDGLDVLWSLKDYGSIDMGTIAVEATATDHTTLAAQANVYQFPENLDVTMTQAQRSALESYLEAHAVPGDWIAPGDTFRSGLRTVTGMFLFMQRLTTKAHSNPLDWGITLNTQWQNLTIQQRGWITESFSSMGYDLSFVRASTQMRRIIKAASEQFGAKPIYFGMVTL